MWQFIQDRHSEILYDAFQHAYLVVLAVFVATILAVAMAVVVTRVPALEAPANALSAVGLTLPAFALVGLLLPVLPLGPLIAFVAVAFYATLVVLRNAVVGLRGVDATLLESAQGMGMGEVSSLVRIRLPLAWPVILAGVRTATQMSMGIAAIAAYVLGPGLGIFIFTGLTQNGGKNATNYALVGTVGIVVMALILDLLLLLLGRVTTSKGIRV